MAMNYKENYLANASFTGPEWIPQQVVFNLSYWEEYREELVKICPRYPLLFPDFEQLRQNKDKALAAEHQRYQVDKWGCEWEYEIRGYDGIVISHPLANWDNLEEWLPPAPPEFKFTEDEIKERKNSGLFTVASGHGFFFMRLYYLRGFENFMLDVALEDPRLDKLVQIVGDYWAAYFQPYLEAGVEVVRTGDDLGTQKASMLGPEYFRRWLLPTYQRLYLPARQAGAHVFMHHDGYIMDILDEIIESGVSIINPQDIVNGIDNLAVTAKGRVSIEIDIDRQKILPYGSPQDVRELVKEEVMKLGSPAGGLSMIAGIYPPTPLENVDALCSALEEFRFYWSEK